MKTIGSLFLSLIALPSLALSLCVVFCRGPLGINQAFGQQKTIRANSSSKSSSKAQSIAKQKKTQPDQLLSLNKNYGPQSSLTADVKKTTKLALLDKTKSSSGTLALSRGKLALELEGDEKTRVVVDGVHAWVVSFPPKEFKDAPRQVLKAKIKGQPKEKMGLAALLSGSGLLEIFKVTERRAEDKKLIFVLAPKKISSDFKKAVIETNLKATEINKLTYWDELDNESLFEFSNTNSEAKPSAKLFKFTPSSKDEITEIE